MRGEAKQSEYVPRLKRVTLPETLLVLSSAVVSVSTLIWVLWSCRYGMDFTDEGFYLLWISNPFRSNHDRSMYHGTDGQSAQGGDERYPVVPDCPSLPA